MATLPYIPKPKDAPQAPDDISSVRDFYQKYTKQLEDIVETSDNHGHVDHFLRQQDIPSFSLGR